MNVYIPLHFNPWELVDPRTFASHGSDSLSLLHPGLLLGMDTIHNSTGFAITVNTWSPWVRNHAATGAPLPTPEEIDLLEDPKYRAQHGIQIWRGLRTPNCGVGDNQSPHQVQPSIGTNAAFDFEIATMTAEEGRQWIQAHKDDPGMVAFMRLEAGRSWIHGDAMAGHGPRVHLFNP